MLSWRGVVPPLLGAPRSVLLLLPQMRSLRKAEGERSRGLCAANSPSAAAVASLRAASGCESRCRTTRQLQAGAAWVEEERGEGCDLNIGDAPCEYTRQREHIYVYSRQGAREADHMLCSAAAAVSPSPKHTSLKAPVSNTQHSTAPAVMIALTVSGDT